MSASLKLAKDIRTGDRILITATGSKDATPGDVVEAVPSVQTLRIPVVIVTVRLENGDTTYRTFKNNHTVRLVDLANGPQGPVEPGGS